MTITDRQFWIDEFLRLMRELDALPEADFEGAAGDAIRDRADGPWRVAAANGFLDELRAALVAHDRALCPELPDS